MPPGEFCSYFILNVFLSSEVDSLHRVPRKGSRSGSVSINEQETIIQLILESVLVLSCFVLGTRR